MNLRCGVRLVLALTIVSAGNFVVVRGQDSQVIHKHLTTIDDYAGKSLAQLVRAADAVLFCFIERSTPRAVPNGLSAEFVAGDPRLAAPNVITEHTVTVFERLKDSSRLPTTNAFSLFEGGGTITWNNYTIIDDRGSPPQIAGRDYVLLLTWNAMTERFLFSVEDAFSVSDGVIVVPDGTAYKQPYKGMAISEFLNIVRASAAAQ
jgi:hypothetical protein